MKIAVVGAGAMGSVYAGLLADGGNEVWAIDVWQAHVDAINNNGLRVEGASGDRTVRLNATTSPADVGECDLIIIATKADGVAGAAQAVDPLLKDDTLILTIQNGLGAAERISQYRAPDNILIGVAGGFGAEMKGPGHTYHNGMELIRVGEMTGGLTDRLEHVAQLWRDAGFSVKAFEPISTRSAQRCRTRCRPSTRTTSPSAPRRSTPSTEWCPSSRPRSGNKPQRMR